MLKYTEKHIDLLILLISFIFAVAYFFMFDFLRYNEADTPNFVNAAQILFGAEGLEDTQSRITKPFVLLFPGFMNSLFGFSITKLMLIQNFLFFIGAGFFYRRLIALFGFNYKLQLMGVFLLFTVQPVAIHSFELINDIAGYCFTILILYAYFRNVARQNEVAILHSLFLFCLITAGLLSKESAGVAVLVIFVHTLLGRKRPRMLHNFVLLFSVFLSYITIQAFIRMHYETNDALSNIVEEFLLHKGLFIRIEQIAHSFDVYWFFIITGAILLIKNYKNYCYARLFVFSAALIVPFLFLWATVQDRTIAVAAPIFLLFVLYALIEIRPNNIFYPMAIVGGFLNVAISYLIYRFNPSNLLLYYYLGYGIIFFALIIFTKRIVIYQFFTAKSNHKDNRILH